MVTEPRTGYSIGWSKDDLVAGDAKTILTRNGITMARVRDDNYLAYGAWMEHGGFAVIQDTFKDSLDGFSLEVTARGALAGGDLTGSAPSGTATWLGLMVGTPQTGSSKGNILQGDAALTFTLENGGSMDAAFTNIADLDRRAPYHIRSVRFNDVPVAGNGTFEAGNMGNRIQGGIYGPGHVETAGTFEKSGIVGAFGGKR